MPISHRDAAHGVHVPGELPTQRPSPLSPRKMGQDDAHLGLLDKVRKVGGTVSHARGSFKGKARGSKYR